jgi:signal transduction histidine kinase
VHFQVRDTGPGIAPSALPHLFEPYWQAEETAHKGAGLGLYITRGIVEAHGGQLWVESAPGEGATFHFTLPRSDALAEQGVDGRDPRLAMQ